MNYEIRVKQLEAEGLSTSDAQAVADAEAIRAKPLAHELLDFVDRVSRSSEASDAMKLNAKRLVERARGRLA